MRPQWFGHLNVVNDKLLGMAALVGSYLEESVICQCHSMTGNEA